MSFLRSLFAQQLVGLDIGVSGVRAVELTGGRAPRLIAYNRVPLPVGALSAEGDFIDRNVVLTALRTLFQFKGFSSKRVAVGASGNAIITKKITVPKMSESELDHQIYWEAEQYIPFNISEVNLDWAIIGNSPKRENEGPKMDVLLVAAKRDYVQSLSNLVREAGLNLEVVDSHALAIGNVFEFNYSHKLSGAPAGSVYVIIDFGAGSTKMTVVEGDKTTFTRELRLSGIGCTQMLRERLGISFDEAERAKILDAENASVQAVVNEYNQGFVEEILRTLDFCISQSSNSSIQGIFVCGGVSRTAGLMKLLDSRLPAPVMPLNPVQNISGSGRKMNAQAIRELSYLGAVAIGLALRTTGDAK